MLLETLPAESSEPSATRFIYGHQNTIMKKTIFAVTTFVALALPAFASTQLRLSDGTTTITVVDGDPNDQSSAPGVVYYNGPVGPNWNVNITVGLSKPAF